MSAPLHPPRSNLEFAYATPSTRMQPPRATYPTSASLTSTAVYACFKESLYYSCACASTVPPLPSLPTTRWCVFRSLPRARYTDTWLRTCDWWGHVAQRSRKNMQHDAAAGQVPFSLLVREGDALGTRVLVIQLQDRRPGSPTQPINWTFQKQVEAVLYDHGYS